MPNGQKSSHPRLGILWPIKDEGYEGYYDDESNIEKVGHTLLGIFSLKITTLHFKKLGVCVSKIISSTNPYDASL